MARRLLLCLLCSLLVAAPASGEDIVRKKRQIDERISVLDQKLARARAKEGVLTQQISIVTAKIRALEDDVRSAQRKLNSLDAELAVHQDKLDKLNDLFVLQTKKLNILRRAYFRALARVERRLIEAYETPSYNAVDVLFASTSFSSMLDQLEYVQQISRQNKHVSLELDQARREMHDVREHTRTIKHRVAVETAAVRVRFEQQRSVTRELISSEQQLATARASKRDTLSSVRSKKQQFLAEADALRQASAELAAKIRSTAGGYSGTPSASGFIWPVNGPVTSPFGWRWGRMHEGIDIGVAYGTPIHASAAGRVVYCGWLGGYGNLVAVDHGGGLSTAYAHQSAIAVSCGQEVAQGQVIGYVGNTGHSFGPHLHFEVRVNGVPVDPLRYL